MGVRVDTYHTNVQGKVICLYVTDCARCGVIFAISTELEQRRREDHQSWYCPNGHGMVFNYETEAERYKRLYNDASSSLAATRSDLARTEAQRRAYKGETTKLKKRAQAGMCAFCRRTFKDYTRHMETEHGEEKGEER